MPPVAKVDVIMVANCGAPGTLLCLEGLLKANDPLLEKLIVVAGSSRDPALERLALEDSRVKVLYQSDDPSDVEACNRGLAERAGDVVLLPSESNVSSGWLSELSAVAHSEERSAFAWPLSSAGLSLAQNAMHAEQLVAGTDGDIGPQAVSKLPRSITTPSVTGGCVYLRAEILDAIGLLDAGLSTRQAAIEDWVMRAQALGFFGKRANHAYADSVPARPYSSDDRLRSSRDRAILEKRHPHLAHQVASFEQSLDGRLAQHACDFLRTGSIRVAYDLRHLPPQNVGTRTYALKLAEALAKIPEIELTFLVDVKAQAAGLSGQIMKSDEWRDEFAVIHKPAQFFNRRELTIPFGSSAHVVITYQDLIAYRVGAVFHGDADFEAYRTTSSLSLLCASGILAYSQSAHDEIASEFGIPGEEIAVAPLGAEADWFARRDRGDSRIRRDLELPDRYFFSLATDYSHKNLSGLLEAYASFRQRSTEGTPPGLVLAGYALSARKQVHAGLESDSTQTGVIFLGPVTPDELRILYQHALAVVFPSLYEGFGLPPLEAMAAGTPVVAMPFSSVPEVGGDAAVYAAGLSSDDLSRAMERVASSAQLRAAMRIKGLKRALQFRWEKTAQANLRAVSLGGPVPLRAVASQSANVARGDHGAGHSPIVTRFFSIEIIPVPDEQILGVRNAWKASEKRLSGAWSERHAGFTWSGPAGGREK